VNNGLKGHGLKTPFTDQALREAAPGGVSKCLHALEKVIVPGADRAELAKVYQEQTRRMEIERQGPELHR